MSLPAEFKGKPFVVLAKLSVNEGKEDRVEELLMAVVKSANSDAEPGCKTYRFNRTADRRTVWMYEEYEDEAALKTHREQSAYQALLKANESEKLLAGLDLNILQEVKPKL